MELIETVEAKNGKVIFLNPRKKVVESIKRMIEQNNGHCPCNPELTEDTICPCKDARERADCRCGLYVNLLEENS